VASIARPAAQESFKKLFELGFTSGDAEDRLGFYVGPATALSPGADERSAARPLPFAL